MDNRNGQGYGYTYDAANRMSTFAINGVVQAEYEYNFLGQQVIRRLTQTGQTIHSIFDAAGHRIAEYDYDDVAGTSSLIREYIWAGDMLVGVFENQQMYFVRTDHIGRPVFATDSSGAKVWEATYLPFGGVQTSTGPNPELRFPGQWFQSETGLHQNWMRDYDPTLGRYLQADPLGLVDGASVYGYALQNPGRYTDPTGEFVPLAAMAAGAAIGAGTGLLGELWRTNGRLECINWQVVGVAAATGIAGGAYTNGALKGLAFAHRKGRGAAVKAFRKAYGIKGRGTEVHHGFVPANGVSGGSLRHHFMNFRPMRQSTHRRVHGRWGGRGKFLGPVGDFLGAPAWLQGGAAAIGLGSIAEYADGDECGCGN